MAAAAAASSAAIDNVGALASPFLTDKDAAFLSQFVEAEQQKRIDEKDALMEALHKKYPDWQTLDGDLLKVYNALFLLDHAAEIASGEMDRVETSTSTMFGQPTTFTISRKDQLEREYCNAIQQPVKTWSKRYPHQYRYKQYMTKKAAIASSARAAENHIRSAAAICAFAILPTQPMPPAILTSLEQIIEIPTKDKGKKRGAPQATAGKIRCLLFPVKDTVSGATVKLYLSRIERKPESGDWFYSIEVRDKNTSTIIALIRIADGQTKMCQLAYLPGVTFDVIREALELLEQDPLSFFGKLGREIGICCWCHHPLTDDGSINNGFGPTCGKYIRCL